MQQGGVQRDSAIEDAITMMKLYKFDELAFETNTHLWDVDHLNHSPYWTKPNRPIFSSLELNMYIY